jgi:hypothetical protein
MTRNLQHYVQRFYLEAFVDAARPTNIWVYDKHTGLIRSQGIRNTAAESLYYSLENPDGSKNNMLDRQVVDKLENGGVPILRRWRAEEPPAILESDLKDMAWYIALSYVRSPRARKDIQDLMAVGKRLDLLEMAESDMILEEIIKETADPDVTKEKLREAFLAAQDPNRITITLSGNAVVASPFLMADRIAPPLVLMHWSILEAPAGTDFVACDSPVSVCLFDDDGHALVGVGIGHAGVEITFPINPRFALRLSWDQGKGYRRLTKRATWHINRRMAAQALRYVYAARRSKRLNTIVRDMAAREPRRRVTWQGRMVRFETFRVDP